MRVLRILAFTVLVMALLSIQNTSPVLSQAVHDQRDIKDESQLRSFAKAYVKILKIRESYEPELSGTQDPQRAREIEHEAIIRIDNAIINEGLTLQAFTRIVEKSNADDILRKRISQLIHEEKNRL